MNGLITPKEVSNLLGIKEQTLAVWRMTEAVKIPYIKIGSAVRYRISDVATYIEENIVH